MIFNGGLIPTYYVISKLGLIDTIWALVLPCGVPIFNVILMMNFFRGIPESLEESAMLEGAGQWTIMSKIYLPLSKPSIDVYKRQVLLQMKWMRKERAEPMMYWKRYCCILITIWRRI